MSNSTFHLIKHLEKINNLQLMTVGLDAFQEFTNVWMDFDVPIIHVT